MFCDVGLEYYLLGRACGTTLYAHKVQRFAPPTNTAHIVGMERNFTVVAKRLYKLVKAQDAGNEHLVKQRALRLACLEVDSAFLLDTADFRRALRAFCVVRSLRGDVIAFNIAAVFDFFTVA